MTDEHFCPFCGCYRACYGRCQPAIEFTQPTRSRQVFLPDQVAREPIIDADKRLSDALRRLAGKWNRRAP